MKKFYLLIACVFLSTNIVSAHISSQEMVTEEFIKNDGFSPEVHRLIRVGTDTKQYRQDLEDKKHNHPIRHFLKRTWVYLDPYEDSGHFGITEIDYDSCIDDI